MIVKPTFQFLTLLFVTKSLCAQNYKAMSNCTNVHSIVYVTVPIGDHAKTLARGLIENKLAACVNIIPKIISIYEWKNEINEDEENMMMIKTRTDTVDTLTKYIREKHPYEVCEVISVPIQNGNPAYFQFIDEVVPPITNRESNKKELP